VGKRRYLSPRNEDCPVGRVDCQNRRAPCQMEKHNELSTDSKLCCLPVESDVIPLVATVANSLATTFCCFVLERPPHGFVYIHKKLFDPTIWLGNRGKKIMAPATCDGATSTVISGPIRFIYLFLFLPGAYRLSEKELVRSCRWAGRPASQQQHSPDSQWTGADVGSQKQRWHQNCTILQIYWRGLRNDIASCRPQQR
jgi:hypothetical protein